MTKRMTPKEVYGYVGQRFTGIIAGFDSPSELLIAEETMRRATEMLQSVRERAGQIPVSYEEE
jgi:hypothetical protein